MKAELGAGARRRGQPASEPAAAPSEPAAAEEEQS